MKANTKSLIVLAYIAILMIFPANASATGNIYATLSANELSKLTIDELLTLDLSELITISDKIADSSQKEVKTNENIEIQLVVLADLDFADLMAVTDQILVVNETSIDNSIISLPFTIFTAIDLKALIILNESCAKYKENHPEMALNTLTK